MPHITTARQTGASGRPGAAVLPAAGPALARDGGVVKATVAPAAAALLAPITLKAKAARPAPRACGRPGRAGAAAAAAMSCRGARAHARATAAHAVDPVRSLATVNTLLCGPGPTGARGVAAARGVASALDGDPGVALETAARALAFQLTANHAPAVRLGRTRPGRAGAPAAPRVAKALHSAPGRARAAMGAARAIHWRAELASRMCRPAGPHGRIGQSAPVTAARGRDNDDALAQAIVRAAAR